MCRIWHRLADIRTARIVALLLAASLLTPACTLPEITLGKNNRVSERASLTSFTNGGSDVDKRYLTTVSIRFSESDTVSPIRFDIRKDKRNLIAARLFESEETKTVLHLGYTRSDGPIVGCIFNWRF